MRTVFSVPARSWTQAKRYVSNASTNSATQQAIKAAYYRGGTSRGVIFQPKDLPSNRSKWPALFRQVMGSPDPYGRQLDGMGAGISSLSKICLVENRVPEGNEVDNGCIDYTFVGMGIYNGVVDVAGNCGNMSSAIGPYAYNAGLLDKKYYAEPNGQVTVRIRNTNTGQELKSTFDVVGGQAAVQGDLTLDGVAGQGSKINLEFLNPSGSKTGKVLPTGNVTDTILGYKVSCVDGPNPGIFIRAEDVDIPGTILPDDFNKLPEKLELLEKIRRAATVAMGIAETEAKVARTIPKIGIVSTSATHPVLSGETVNREHVDVVIRFLSDEQPHRAIPLTMALTSAVAAKIPGTIVEQLLAKEPVARDMLTIGHASGKIQVNASMDPEKPHLPLSASVFRTARRIFQGKVFWTDSGEKEEGLGSISRSYNLGMAFVEESKNN